MSEDKKVIDNSDRQRLNTFKEYEFGDWSKKYGVSFDQLKTCD